MARQPRRAPRHAAETPYQRRKRIYAERHPGATTQQMRGHRAGEHVARKKREQEEIGVTTYERSKIREFAKAQAKKSGDDWETIYDDLLPKVQERGYAAFRDTLVKPLAAMGKETRHVGKVIEFAGRSRRLAHMQEIADDWDIDLTWAYYNN
jgi:hypothetical protein